ncbi:MAG: transcriptional regulator [Oscillatoriales cyanobacterium C42_A2020_001]|nr:transcriptional regulator [Leptolyngbyaceae cyanobacterium C42_A2020_001]
MSITFDKDSYTKLLVEFQPRVITTENEYERALEIVQQLMANKERTPEQTALMKLLVLLIENYEEEHYPMPTVLPHEMVQHLMEARGLRQADLIEILGSKGVVSEVVRGKRKISKAQAKSLGEFFHVSPALFI